MRPRSLCRSLRSFSCASVTGARIRRCRLYGVWSGPIGLARLDTEPLYSSPALTFAQAAAPGSACGGRRSRRRTSALCQQKTGATPVAAMVLFNREQGHACSLLASGHVRLFDSVRKPWMHATTQRHVAEPHSAFPAPMVLYSDRNQNGNAGRSPEFLRRIRPHHGATLACDLHHSGGRRVSAGRRL